MANKLDEIMERRGYKVGSFNLDSIMESRGYKPVISPEKTMSEFKTEVSERLKKLRDSGTYDEDTAANIFYDTAEQEKYKDITKYIKYERPEYDTTAEERQAKLTQGNEYLYFDDFYNQYLPVEVEEPEPEKPNLIQKLLGLFKPKDKQDEVVSVKEVEVPQATEIPNELPIDYEGAKAKIQEIQNAQKELTYTIAQKQRAGKDTKPEQEQLKALRNEEKALKAQASGLYEGKKAQEFETKYSGLENAPDFQEKVQQGIQQGKGAKHRYINNINNEREKLALQGDIAATGNPYAKYDLMTADEIALYNALVTEGKGNQYLKDIDRELNARLAAINEKVIQESAQKYPVMGVLGHTAASMAAGGGALQTLAQSAKNLITGEEERVDINSPLFNAVNMQDAITEGLTQNMGEVGKFLTSTGLSILASAARIGLGPTGAAVVAGSGAAASAAKDSIERGGTQGQAAASAIASGLAEYVFEKISLESLFKLKTPANIKDVINNVLKQSFVEGSEELFTEIANIITDSLIMGDLSNYQLAVKNYMAQGMSEETAKKQAIKDIAMQIGTAWGAGVISGGFFGGAQGPVSIYNASRIGANVDPAQEIEIGLSMPPDTEAYKLASALNGKNMTNAQAGALHIANVQAQQAKEKAAFQADLEALGLDPVVTKKAINLYDKADMKTLNRVKTAVSNATAVQAEANADLNVTQTAIKARLTQYYDAVIEAVRNNDTQAYSLAKAKYLAEYEVAQAESNAAKVKADNEIKKANRIVNEAVATAEFDVKQAQAEEYAKAQQNAAEAKIRALQTTTESGTITPNGGVSYGGQSQIYSGLQTRNVSEPTESTERRGGSISRTLAQEGGNQQGIRRSAENDGQSRNQVRGLQATPQAQESIQRHVETVFQATGRATNARIINEVDEQTAKILDTVKGITGRDVFLFEGDDNYGHGWSDDNGIFIRVNSIVPVAFLYGHEAAHADSRITNAGLEVIKDLSRDVSAYKKYRDANISTPDNADIRRELVADVFGSYIYEMLTGERLANNFGINPETVIKLYDAFEQALGVTEIKEGEDAGTVIDRASGYYAASDPEYSRVDFIDKTNATETKQFKQFFGDWQNDPANASKVVDESGSPLVVYHGTNANKDFNVFDTWGSNFGLVGQGSYFTENRDIAEQYTKKGKGTNPRIYEAYLNIRNPLDMDAVAEKNKWNRALKQADIDINLLETNTNWDIFNAVKEYLTDEGYYKHDAEEVIYDLFSNGMGHDGITHLGGDRYTKSEGIKHRVWVAFEPTQIKSIKNIGTFDANNGNIYYSRLAFSDEYGIEYSINMPEIQERTDLAIQRNGGDRYYVDVTIKGEKQRLTGNDKAELEARVQSLKKSARLNNLSESVKALREASRLYMDGVTVEQYYSGENPEYRVARLLRGMYLRNGVNQGGALSEQEIQQVTQLSDKWKDKSALAYGRETLERNLEDIASSPQEGRMLVETYVTPIRKDVAEMIRWMRSWTERIRALNLNTEDSAAVQLLGEGLITNEMLEKGLLYENGQPMDIKKIESAVKVFKEFYAEALNKANAARIINGYRPIQARKDYFPHIDEHMSDWQKFMTNVVKGADITLPTEINAITETFRPGTKWFRNFQRRIGDKTAYDAVRGFNQYLSGVAHVIYLTDDIQRLRQLDAYIRDKYSMPDPNSELKGDQRRKHLSGFVAQLTEYTNLLAGKQATFDRAFESAIGRKALGWMNWLKKRFGANAVGVNISTALSNFIPFTQGLATIKKGSFLKGMQAALSRQVRMDQLWLKSDFLTSRFGKPDEIVTRRWDTLKQNASNTANWLFESIDRFTAETLVFGKYDEYLKQGLSEAEAMRRADEYAERTMAGRSIGSMPTLFQIKTLSALTQFQLEINNQMSNIMKDFPRWSGGDKRKLVKALVQLFVYSWLFNEIDEKYITGRRRAFDPIGVLADAVDSIQNEKLGDALESIGTNVLDQLPFGQLLTGGGRYPLASAIEGTSPLDAIKKTLNGEDSGEAWEKFAIAFLANFALPAGGGQLRKTITGISDYEKGGKYYGEKLAYPIEQDAGTLIKSIIFGSSSVAPQGWDWKDTLSESKTGLYEQLKEAGIENAYGLLNHYASLPTPDNAKATKLVALATYDADNDGKPDYSAKDYKLICDIMGIEVKDIAKASDIKKVAQKAADKYIKDQRKDKSLTPEQLEKAEENYNIWKKLLGER